MDEEQFSGRKGSEDLLEQKILRVLKKKQKLSTKNTIKDLLALLQL